MDIEVRRLDKETVEEHLMRCEGDFNPPLSSHLDLGEYAEKLSQNAEFVILSDGGSIEGSIAFYTNREGGFAYVSHFWVCGLYRGKGYSKLLLDKLMEYLGDSCRVIRLEVSKTNPARFFYQKRGFQIVEDRGEKWLLSLTI